MSENLGFIDPLKIVVVDDHDLILNGTFNMLKQKYPKAKIYTAQTAVEVLCQVEAINPNLLVMDLCLPEKAEIKTKTDTGIQLLRTVMKNYPTLNILVQSTYIKTLVRIRPEIDSHRGGFTIADKSLPTQEILTRVDWSLQGLTHIKDLKGVHSGLEVKPEWLNLLILAFEEGLQDKAIAEQMGVSERMVRHYWTKIQDVLGVYPEEGQNIRIKTEIRAREEGLID
ncbi:response regulator receiver protein [Gloeothece citriformis PCC 7424]|uniref:Response regulator receiver protein n=1 Tax=Gloeothece citriformis (strain PCC 7424) TaxID=65393 RepID=B7KKU5_GLOC7|nr:response regulator transcription factor [Gloeothece citriformis]ACK71064.1 response regulator receiver protein [Gloeothece citriformis PCC 7424]